MESEVRDAKEIKKMEDSKRAMTRSNGQETVTLCSVYSGELELVLHRLSYSSVSVLFLRRSGSTLATTAPLLFFVVDIYSWAQQWIKRYIYKIHAFQGRYLCLFVLLPNLIISTKMQGNLSPVSPLFRTTTPTDKKVSPTPPTPDSALFKNIIDMSHNSISSQLNCVKAAAPISSGDCSIYSHI
jgi:hypothetical protein